MFPKLKPAIARSKYFSRQAFLLSAVLVATGFLLITTSCSSGELSRSQAGKMISESNDFRQPSVIEFVQGGHALVGRGQGAVESTSDDEPEAEAVRRRISEHYAANPRMEVADHFGLIKPEIKRTNDKPDPRTSVSSFWYFDERYIVTDKGRKIWEELKLPVNETAVPISEKEFIEVTGITKQSDNTVQVDYKWQWKPNEIGRSLDSSSAEFKALPEKTKSDLLAPPTLYTSRDRMMSWTGEQQAKAKFQRYDDGWRIVTVTTP